MTEKFVAWNRCLLTTLITIEMCCHNWTLPYYLNFFWVILILNYVFTYIYTVIIRCVVGKEYCAVPTHASIKILFSLSLLGSTSQFRPDSLGRNKGRSSGGVKNCVGLKSCPETPPPSELWLHFLGGGGRLEANHSFSSSAGTANFQTFVTFLSWPFHERFKNIFR